MVVKRATSLFNSFCSNVAKHVARLCFPFFRSFKIQRRDGNQKKKKNRLNKQNNNFARASKFFCTLLCRFCTTTKRNFSFSWTWIWGLGIQLQGGSPTFAKYVGRKKIEITQIHFSRHVLVAVASSLIGWFSNRTRTSDDDGKARGKDWTRLPVPNLLLCHWSSQLFDLRALSSTDVPVLLLSQHLI